MGPPIAHLKIRWLNPSEGGRQSPPQGPTYAATARFAADPEDQLFSIMLRFPNSNSHSRRIQKADLVLLVPENLPEVQKRLVPGIQLFVTEGRRVVAEGKVLSPVTRLKLSPLTEQDYELAAQEYCRSLPLEHFMEAKPQATQREITLESLALLKARRPDVHVFNEMLVQYPWRGGPGQVVPDNMVVISKKPLRAVGSYNLPYEPAKPFLVMEYVSRSSRRKDYEDSFRKYENELRVRYCLLFYPERQDLQVFRHGGRRYRQLKPNAARRYAIPELDLEVGLRDGWVRFYYQGQLLELPAELQHNVDTEKKLRSKAEAEVERLRALVEKLQRENGTRSAKKKR